jgi:glycine betaine/proline transport system ATP-binding protein
VVQAGTAEDIVLNPATDYVREFTGAVPRAKVVRAARVMGAARWPGAGPQGAGPHLCRRCSAAVSRRDGCGRVTDAGGRIVGHLSRATVVDLMLAG